ncbi:MAG: hypothetical protein JO317_06815 [Verrucomicrobiae bacterium]|nr:hypothetical protein [Verrucomicrobiae bacterium]
MVEAAAGSKLWELDFRIPRAIWKELPRLAEPAKTPRVWRAADRDVRRFHLAFLNIDRERLGQWPHSIEVQEAWLHWVLVCFERSLRRTRVQKALSRERPGNGHGAESEAHSWDTSNSPTPTILPDSDGLTG